MENMVLVRIRNIQTGKAMARVVSRVDLKTIPRRVKGDVEINNVVLFILVWKRTIGSGTWQLKGNAA